MISRRRGGIWPGVKFIAFGIALLVCAVTFGAACSDDPPDAMSGSKPGTERWVVYLASQSIDLAPYKKAQAEGDPLDVIEAKLVKEMKAESKRFARGLKELNGSVIEYWVLSNAITIEVPAGNVGSVGTMEGVEKMIPDTVLK